MGNIEPSSRVLIIGGGVCGLALALALKKAGIASEVYEAGPIQREGAGGGFNIAPNGMKVLATLGVWPYEVVYASPGDHRKRSLVPE